MEPLIDADFIVFGEEVEFVEDEGFEFSVLLLVRIGVHGYR